MGIAADPAKEETGMPIAQITRPGLAAVAISVALLWTCVIGERLMMRQAALERATVMRQVVRSRQRAEPVVAPAPFVRHRAHSHAG